MDVKKRPLLAVVGVCYPEQSKDYHFSRILCGEVLVNGVCIKDPKLPVPVDSKIECISRAFVSRGGEKLSHALRKWNFSVKGKIILDAGSSTGGFTDALLQAGAAGVHAVDVGVNQLAYKLRGDSRVSVHEGRNIMNIESLEPQAEGATADLSFRSLLGALNHIIALTSGGWCIALIKPQFEWKNPDNSFRGVVNNRKDLEQIMKDFFNSLHERNLSVSRLCLSPIKGRKGNREFLSYITAAGAGPIQKDRKEELDLLSEALAEY